jgi:hypothetical protein
MPHLGIDVGLPCVADVLLFTVYLADCPVRASAAVPETALCVAPAPCTYSMRWRHLVLKCSLGNPIGKDVLEIKIIASILVGSCDPLNLTT